MVLSWLSWFFLVDAEFRLALLHLRLLVIGKWQVNKEWWIEPDLKLVADSGETRRWVGIKVVPASELEEAVKLLGEMARELQGANTFLRDIAQLQRVNVQSNGTPVGIHEIFEFAKEVAGSGYIQSGHALDKIKASGLVKEE
jgi:hypothetical protein